MKIIKYLILFKTLYLNFFAKNYMAIKIIIIYFYMDIISFKGFHVLNNTLVKLLVNYE